MNGGSKFDMKWGLKNIGFEHLTAEARTLTVRSTLFTLDMIYAKSTRKTSCKVLVLKKGMISSFATIIVIRWTQL